MGERAAKKLDENYSAQFHFSKAYLMKLLKLLKGETSEEYLRQWR